MSIVDKAKYLMATKNGLKDIINEKGGTIDNETLFRSYINQIKSFQLSGESISVEPRLLLQVGQQTGGSGNKPIGVEPSFKAEDCDEYVTYNSATGIFTVNSPCSLIATYDIIGRSSSSSNNPYTRILINEVEHSRPSVVAGNYHCLNHLFINGEGTTFRMERYNTTGYLTVWARVYLIDDNLYEGLKLLNTQFATL